MNLRALIYQDLQTQKSEIENDIKTARLRQLEAEAQAQEGDAKANMANIDFENCDFPARLRRETSNVTCNVTCNVTVTPDGKKTAYSDYEKSLDEWVTETRIDLKLLKKEAIFKQVKLFDKKLWSITESTFNRDIWPAYSKKRGLQKQSGRPKNK